MLYYTQHTPINVHNTNMAPIVVSYVPPSITPLPHPPSPLDHPLCHSNVTNIIRWKVPWLENYTGITFWEEKELNKQALGYHMDFIWIAYGFHELQIFERWTFFCEHKNIAHPFHFQGFSKFLWICSPPPPSLPLFKTHGF